MTSPLLAALAVEFRAADKVEIILHAVFFKNFLRKNARLTCRNGKRSLCVQLAHKLVHAGEGRTLLPTNRGVALTVNSTARCTVCASMP